MQNLFTLSHLTHNKELCVDQNIIKQPSRALNKKVKVKEKVGKSYITLITLKNCIQAHTSETARYDSESFEKHDSNIKPA